MKRRISQPVLIALIALGFVLVGLGGWFLLIGPQRAHAGDLDKQIADTNDADRCCPRADAGGEEGRTIRVADLYRLAKAMPDQADMPGIILELNQGRRGHGITLRADHSSDDRDGDLGVTGASRSRSRFQGNFYDLSDFLYRLRNLVDVRAARWTRRGAVRDRLDRLRRGPPPPGFPQIRAHLVIDAFVFGTGPLRRWCRRSTRDRRRVPRATGATGTTPTTTTPTPTTPAPTDATRLRQRLPRTWRRSHRPTRRRQQEAEDATRPSGACCCSALAAFQVPRRRWKMLHPPNVNDSAASTPASTTCDHRPTRRPALRRRQRDGGPSASLRRRRHRGPRTPSRSPIRAALFAFGRFRYQGSFRPSS